MKCNLYLDKGTDKAIVVPTNYNEKVVIENIGDNYKRVGVVEIPCYEEEDSYYVYSFKGYYTDKLILHLKNKKFYEAAKILASPSGDYGILECYINTIESFQYKFEELCDEYPKYSTYNREFKKLTKQEGEDLMKTIKTMQEAFEKLHW